MEATSLNFASVSAVRSFSLTCITPLSRICARATQQTAVSALTQCGTLTPTDDAADERLVVGLEDLQQVLLLREHAFADVHKHRRRLQYFVQILLTAAVTNAAEQ